MNTSKMLKSAFSGLGQKGQSMNDVIYACISIVIGLVVVVAVLGTASTQVATLNTTASNTTYNSIQTGIFSAFSLSTVVPIVIIASLIFLYLRAR